MASTFFIVELGLLEHAFEHKKSPPPNAKMAELFDQMAHRNPVFGSSIAPIAVLLPRQMMNTFH